MDSQFKDRIDELRREAKVADKIDKERVEQFQTLLSHPGWAIYQGLLSSRIQSFGETVMTPAGSIDGAIALEWIKGAMSGLIMARDIPSVTIAAMTGPAPEGDDE